MTTTTTDRGAPTALEVEDLLLDGVPVPCSELENMHTRGLYAWWDQGGALDGLWPEGLESVDVARPLYVGQARTTLAERATKMHLRKTRVSTLRRNLASLLADQLDLADTFSPYYQQPNCPRCGRYAHRDGGHGAPWTFDCSWWDGTLYVHE